MPIRMLEVSLPDGELCTDKNMRCPFLHVRETPSSCIEFNKPLNLQKGIPHKCDECLKICKGSEKNND